MTLSKAALGRKFEKEGRVDVIDFLHEHAAEYLSELSGVSRVMRVTYKECQSQGNATGAETYFRQWKRTEGKIAELKRYLQMFERNKAGYEMEIGVTKPYE